MTELQLEAKGPPTVPTQVAGEAPWWGGTCKPSAAATGCSCADGARSDACRGLRGLSCSWQPRPPLLIATWGSWGGSMVGGHMQTQRSRYRLLLC